MLQKFIDWLTDKRLDGDWQPPDDGRLPPPMPMFATPRSPDWPKLRKLFLFEHPYCAGCGATTFLNVHHIRPFWIFPSLELDPQNLIVLCEGPMACHFALGHLGLWKSFNLDVVKDAAARLHRVRTRP